MAKLNEFSVVIPLYNKRPYVARAISSVLNQTLQHFELLVIDDGSTDGSDREVSAIHDSRVRLIQQPNSGVSTARNTGIRYATHEYIAFLDADDAWLPDFLRAISNLIDRFPNAIAYATNYYKDGPTGFKRLAQPENVAGTENEWLMHDYFKRVATGSTPISSSSVCIPKPTFQRLGHFPTDVALYEDLYMWTCIVLAGPVAYSSTPRAVYYRDADGRACNYIVPKRSDLPFKVLISDAINGGRLDARESYFASVFVAKYGLLNAFKALVGGYPSEARATLGSLEPATVRQWLRLYAIYVFSLLPQATILYVWRFVKSAKQLVNS